MSEQASNIGTQGFGDGIRTQRRMLRETGA